MEYVQGKGEGVRGRNEKGSTVSIKERRGSKGLGKREESNIKGK